MTAPRTFNPPTAGPAPRPAYPPIRDKPDGSQPRFAESPFGPGDLAATPGRKPSAGEEGAGPASATIDRGKAKPQGHC